MGIIGILTCRGFKYGNKGGSVLLRDNIQRQTVNVFRLKLSFNRDSVGCLHKLFNNVQEAAIYS